MPASSDPTSKQVNPPRTGEVPTNPAQVSASMATNQGNIGLQLDNGKAPCTVNASPAWPSRATSTTPRAIG